MNDDEILALQRTLRRRFFEGAQSSRWRPGREIVAELLLYLDDPAACWRLMVNWLRATLDADRVDAGFGGFVGPGGRRDYVVSAESQREERSLPSVLGRVFDASDPGLSTVWKASGFLPLESVQQASVMTRELRGALRALGTSAKLAIPVRDGPYPVGMICADWQRESPRWPAQLCLEIGRLVEEALGPLMAAAQRLTSTERTGTGLREPPFADGGNVAEGLANWDALTAAERKVALLIAAGVSYKEAARDLGRSLSTVDHQLRSIRLKLGVSSTARLVHLLSVHLDPRAVLNRKNGLGSCS